MLRTTVLALGVLLAAAFLPAQAQPGPYSADGKYVVIGYNDLGMHCINPRYQDICLLPPANNLNVFIIRRGVEPSIVNSGLSVRYVMPTNRYPETNTNFWKYSYNLFGLNLAPGVGLTGNKTAGLMARSGDHFEATAIPAVPYNDDKTRNYYQTAKVKVLNSANTLIMTTDVVIPVSDEMNCQKCHASGQIAAKNINMPTLEQNILTLHDLRNKTNLMNQRPVLCAKCHSDNALKAPGTAGVPSLSLAMHKRHAALATQPACYDCHPGANTQCNRSALPGMGATSPTTPGCNKCHGNLSTMASGLVNGRQPWLQEPTCAQCHGSEVSTGTTLYRNARGHGGVPCVVCHNSPHAWWPTKNALDNAQPIALQGTNRALGYQNCKICHTDGRIEDKPPHGNDD